MTAPMNDINVKRREGAGGALDLSRGAIGTVVTPREWGRTSEDTDRYTFMSTDRYTLLTYLHEAQGNEHIRHHH